MVDPALATDEIFFNFMSLLRKFKEYIGSVPVLGVGVPFRDKFRIHYGKYQVVKVSPGGSLQDRGRDRGQDRG